MVAKRYSRGGLTVSRVEARKIGGILSIAFGRSRSGYLIDQGFCIRQNLWAHAGFHGTSLTVLGAVDMPVVSGCLCSPIAMRHAVQDAGMHAMSVDNAVDPLCSLEDDRMDYMASWMHQNLHQRRTFGARLALGSTSVSIVSSYLTGISHLFTGT